VRGRTVNDFLQQFLIESRELIDQASDGLLSLERSPADAGQLDAVFRAFHTLKGGAGIVEFPAMERVMHAAEEVLTDARSGKRPLTAQRVGGCLACLDQVLQWLDTLEQTDGLPVISDEQVEQIVRQVAASAGAGGGTPAPGIYEPGSAGKTWVAEILERHPARRAEAATAIRYTPDMDCFYRGEDPVARLTALPCLLALELEPVIAWAPLETLDPYASNLTLTALTATSLRDASAHMQGYTGECEMLAVVADTVSRGEASLPQRARDVLEAQVALLASGDSASSAGRVGSAGVVAANVLRFCGRDADAAMLAQATDRSLRENTRQYLGSALAQMLGLGSAAREVAADSTHRAQVAPRTLRIDTQRIEALVRLTGELTVAKNSIGHIAGVAQASNDTVASTLKSHYGVLERLIGELQRSVLEMRVLPLRTVLQRFPRVLRELSASLGKSVELGIAGDDTEADKAIVEMLFVPLLHIVRNAIDPGIEPPSERAARGKPPVATLQIRASRQSDRIHLEVSDDGAGIDVDRVREVARQRGLVAEDALQAMTEADIMDLVFAPGFSTAAKVTDVSGRGVGMDAVRSAVERIGGRVAVESRRGHGTTVRLSLPFSVMMTRVMTVETGGQMFGIPLDAVVETVRVARENIAGIGAGRATVLRERTIPIVELAGVLGVSREKPEEAEAIIVVTTFGGQLGGIQVERLGERMEVMLEPLEGLLLGAPGIAGTSLLGDGRVLLVLDIAELLQ
jgi:two-component system chemotaxis sensor kinase CheA